MKKLLFILALLFSAPTFAATQIDLETQVKGVLPAANGGTSVTATTGTGNAVLSDSPTFTGTINGVNADFSGDITAANLATAGTITTNNFCSAASASSIQCTTAPSVGQILNNNAFTATPTLGASGTLGSLTMGNATSGTVTLAPVSGALGTVTLSLPARTATIGTTSGTLTSGNCAKFDAGGNIVDNGAACGGGAQFATESVTAGTTQTQAGATNLSASAYVHFVTVSNNNDGVRLPACDSTTAGSVHFITGPTSGAPPNRNLKIYGASTDTVNGVATATGVTFNITGGAITAICLGGSPGNWQVLAYPTPQVGNGLTFSFAGTALPNITLQSATTPTLASGGCTSPGSVTGSTLSWAYNLNFSINVGTGCSGSQPLVFTLTAATTGWNCYARNTTNAATSAPAHSSGVSTTSVTITNYARTTGVAAAWNDNDVITVSCLRQ